MNWSFSEDAPIYLQIMNQFKAQIASGVLPPGEKIPSVRELALEAQVNPNTMQKALAELEREGILYSKRTAGRFVSDNSNRMNDLQRDMAQSHLEKFVENMKNLGYELPEIRTLFLDYYDTLDT